MTRRGVLGLGIALLLAAGCAGHTHTLSSQQSGAFASGQIVHGGPQDANRLTLERAGKRFEGSFSVVTETNWKEVSQRYRNGGRHWDRIISGLDKDHLLRTARAELKSDDGDALVCDLAWRYGTDPAGVCRPVGDTGKVYAVRFE